MGPYGQMLAAPSSNHTDLDAKIKDVEASMRELVEVTSGKDKAIPAAAPETPLLAPSPAIVSPVAEKNEAEPVESSAAGTSAEIASPPTDVYDPPPRPVGNAEAKPIASAVVESTIEGESTNVATSASAEPSVSESTLTPTTLDAKDLGQVPAAATEEAKPSPVV